MEPEEIAKSGNRAAIELCEQLMRLFGPQGDGYSIAVGTAATAMLFHAYRISRRHSKKRAVDVLQAILDDVARNIKDLSNDEIKVTVTRPVP